MHFICSEFYHSFQIIFRMSGQVLLNILFNSKSKTLSCRITPTHYTVSVCKISPTPQSHHQFESQDKKSGAEHLKRSLPFSLLAVLSSPHIWSLSLLLPRSNPRQFREFHQSLPVLKVPSCILSLPHRRKRSLLVFFFSLSLDCARVRVCVSVVPSYMLLNKDCEEREKERVS